MNELITTSFQELMNDEETVGGVRRIWLSFI